MLLKAEIEQAYQLQQVGLLDKKETTERYYLKNIDFRSSHIEVISGIRRCGKSTFMGQIMGQFGSNIAYFNFEDSRVFDFEVTDFQKLNEIMGNEREAYFFDEIQNVASWEVFIRQLHDKGKKVFITGSNASLLSKELGTRLTGRHLRQELFPFSYTEYLLHKKLENSLEAFESYIQKGGFPEFINFENQDILQTLLKDIVLRDIAVRYGLKNIKTVMDICLFLVSNIGKECTYNSLKKAFSVGSANSVSDYLAWFEDSYLLFFLPRFSWSAKSIAINPRKIYAIDNGLVQANSLSFTKDKGRLLENAVYLFLRQKYQSLFYFQDKNECDFIVFEKNQCKMVIQVCGEIHSDNKNREVNGLVEAMTFFKLTEGYIITKDQSDLLLVNQKTIHLISAWQFMTSNYKKSWID